MVLLGEQKMTGNYHTKHQAYFDLDKEQEALVDSLGDQLRDAMDAVPCFKTSDNRNFYGQLAYAQGIYALIPFVGTYLAVTSRLMWRWRENPH